MYRFIWECSRLYKKFVKRRGTKASHGATEARSLEMLKKDPNGEEILKLIDANVMTPELVYASRVLMVKAYDQAKAAAEILLEKTTKIYRCFRGWNY